jgi:3-oxoacyl-[acyl-carrier-protein] synthase-1
LRPLSDLCGLKKVTLSIPVYAIASHIVSSLGMDADAHWQAVMKGEIGIKRYEDTNLSPTPFMASKLDAAQWQTINEQTKPLSAPRSPLTPFEQMAVYTAQQALSDVRRCHGEFIELRDCALILSTTKGNIELLGQAPDEQLHLHHSARQIAAALGITTKPFVISVACVSGVAALQYGMRLIQSGRYPHAIVVGADRFSRFVLAGFQSFQAISPEPCRPFDAGRRGITLGEAAATIILSADRCHGDPDSYRDEPLPTANRHLPPATCHLPLAQLASGATSNDANHISGPSRTGHELAMAITRALAEARLSPTDIDMISAHGTATLFNDEMESRAFHHAGVQHSPVHSFKGYIGHTLGAAGIAESVMILQAMRHRRLIPSASFSTPGTPMPLNVTAPHSDPDSYRDEPRSIKHVLKTSSGFGGSNAVIVWKKVE